MTPEQAHERAELHGRALALIARLSDGTRDDVTRDRLLLALAEYQRRYVQPYENFSTQRLKGKTPVDVAHVPALPTDAFRFARISSRHPQDQQRLFRSSGTTHDERSEHALADLSLYDASAKVAARYALFPDRPRMSLLILAPSESELGDSSLSYMLARFVEWFGNGRTRHVWPIGEDEIRALDHTLRATEETGEPVALLGTSFAFVHALDLLGSTKYRLPPGSRVMQTGGFKGRSREVAPEAMRAWLSESFGIPEAFVVAEYGMTELSSQLYETSLRQAVLGQQVGPRRLWAPSFVRVSVVDPESLLPAADGERGLVRIDDVANLDSVGAIQTADLGQLDAHGLSLLGRAQGAVARGCSITADQLLQRRTS
ncbi:MAG: hypothetical protein QM778_27680 [Myxococcales bacterium]